MQFGRPVFELQVKTDYCKVTNCLLERNSSFVFHNQRFTSNRRIIFEEISNLCTLIRAIMIQISTSGYIHTPLKSNLLRKKQNSSVGRSLPRSLNPTTAPPGIGKRAEDAPHSCPQISDKCLRRDWPQDQGRGDAAGAQLPASCTVRCTPRSPAAHRPARREPAHLPAGRLARRTLRGGSIKEHRRNPEDLCLKEKNKVVLNCKQILQQTLQLSLIFSLQPKAVD